MKRAARKRAQRLSVILTCAALGWAGMAVAQVQSPPPKGVDDTVTTGRPKVPAVPPATAQKQQTQSSALSSQKLNELRKALAASAAPPVDDSAMSFAPGVVVPASVEFHPLPAAAAAVSTTLAGNSYFVGRIDYFIVDPNNRKITLIVPKDTGL